MTKTAHKHPMRFDDPLTLFPWAMTRLFSLWVSQTYPFSLVGSNLSIHYTVLLDRRMATAFRIGNSVKVRKDAWLNTFDLTGANDELRIVIEDNCVIGARTVISAKNMIHIEHDVLIGSSVLIQDHNHAYENLNLPIRAQGLTPGGSIRIEHSCCISPGVAIVSPQGELVMGHNCVVAPNAVVTRSFPPYSLVGGNPARVLEQLDPSKTESLACLG